MPLQSLVNPNLDNLNQPLDTTANPTFNTVSVSGSPVSSLQVATKAYVDNLVAGINFHAPVVAATAGNLAGTYNNGTSGVGATITKASNGSIGTIDGATVIVGDRILLRAQTDNKENGIYTIALAMTDGLFNNNSQDIFLEDKYTNTIHNLRQNPYVFSSDAGSFTDRFLIRYHDVSNLNSGGNIDNNTITIWTNNYINIKSDIQKISQVTVYDVLGRKINSTDNLDSNVIEIPNLKSNNTYILKIKFQNGVVVYRKIVF
jgi:hypothetical protein